MPRKRTLAALLLIGGAAGLCAGAIDRARGAAPSAALIFSEPPAELQSRPGHPAAAPASFTQAAAAFQEQIHAR